MASAASNDLLRREGLVSVALAQKMLAWRHTGFSAHNAVRVGSRDASGRRRLAQYMLRAPFSLEKMSYDPAPCMVIYRSRMHKTLKRNFQIMHGAEPAEAATREVDVHEAARLRSTWARLIHKVYEVDPLECPTRRDISATVRRRARAGERKDEDLWGCRAARGG